MAPIMRTMMLYGFPFFVFIATGYFPAVCAAHAECHSPQ
jgi:hypothetical protein